MKNKQILPLLIACGLVSSASAANLVVNGGFEKVDDKGTAGWRPDGTVWSLGETAGVDESRGLVWRNDDPKRYVLPSQNPKLEGGKRYRLCVKVRCQDLKGGTAGCCLEWYGADGHWKGGIYPTGIKGTVKDWVEISGITPPIPTGMVRYVVEPLCSRGATGAAWFDDLRLVEVEMPDIDGVYSDRYRNGAAAGLVTFKAVLNESARTEGATGVFCHAGAEQPLPTKGTARLAIEKGVCSWMVPVEDFVLGENRVRFALLSAKGQVLASKDIRFCRLTKDEEASRTVRIDEHRRTLVDGKPFFPLGMYWGQVTEKELDIYKEGPFNCLMPYRRPTREQMDLCQARGLKVIYNVVDAYAGKFRGARPPQEEAVETFASYFRRFRSHPALLAWYLNDEMPISYRDELATARRLAEELDPNHPTWIAIYQNTQVRDYLPTFDVVGTDPYPLFRNPIGMVSEWTRNTRAGLLGLKPMWQIPQVFDKWAYEVNRRKPEICKAPSEEEVRNMAWQCLAGGANGLVFYSFFDLVAMDARTPFAQRWAEVKRVACEIKSCEDFFLSAEPELPLADVPEVPGTRAWVKDGRVLVAVVNTTREPQTARIALPKGISGLKTVLGSGVSHADETHLAVDLPAIGVAVVETTIPMLGLNCGRR